MKKLVSLLILAMGMTVALFAADEPFQIVSMEDVAKWGSNCDYDSEKCEATFTGSYDRWFDLPGVQGDYSKHSKIQVDVLKSNVILKFVLRFRTAEGKTDQVTVATLYGQMGSSITKKKTIKLDLRGEDGQYTEQLKNLQSIRISMAKLCEDAEGEGGPFVPFPAGDL